MIWIANQTGSENRQLQQARKHYDQYCINPYKLFLIDNSALSCTIYYDYLVNTKINKI